VKLKLNRALGLAATLILGIPPKGQVKSGKAATAKKRKQKENDLDALIESAASGEGGPAVVQPPAPAAPVQAKAAAPPTAQSGAAAEKPATAPPAPQAKDGAKAPPPPPAVLPNPKPLEVTPEDKAAAKELAAKAASGAPVVSAATAPEPVLKKIEDVKDIKPKAPEANKAPEGNQAPEPNKAPEPGEKTEAKDKDKDKDKEKEEEGGKSLFANLFNKTEEKEETPLDKLIKSMPDITIDEVMSEAEEVRGLIAEWSENRKNN
jgi:hypothetical protein